MSTVREVAKHAGVSIGTVSRVLNDHPQVSERARRKVMEAISTTKYSPAGGKTTHHAVAMIYTGPGSLGSPFDAALMQGMSAILDRDGLDLHVMQGGKLIKETGSLARYLKLRGVCGALVRTVDQARELPVRLAEEGLPTVVIADRFESAGLSYVYADAEGACRRAIEHLIHLGHRRIAIAVNVVDDFDHSERRRFYRETLAEHGLEPDPRLELRVPAYKDAGRMALRQIMAMPDRPTAVFMTDALAAVGLGHEAMREGVSIPNDLSVVTFDDTDQRYSMYPTLAAVCQDAEDLGARALDQLLSQSTGRHPGQPTVVECWFEPNESVAPPRS